MAIYQFNCQLIPSKWVKENKEDVALLYDGDMFDTSIAWEEVHIPDCLEKLISKILPLEKENYSDCLMWGKHETHMVEVCFIGDKIDSFSVRIDLRENNIKEYIANITDIAIKTHCDFFVPETKMVFSPNAKELESVIANSNAARFVENPFEYLKLL